MNLLNILLENTSVNPGPLTISGVLSLWNVARDKIIAWETYILYVRQAQDPKLRKVLETRLHIIPKQVARIEEFMKKKGVDGPKTPNWERKINDTSPFVVSTNLLSDMEIGMGLREHLMYSITHETEGLRNAVQPDTRKILL